MKKEILRRITVLKPCLGRVKRWLITVLAAFRVDRIAWILDIAISLPVMLLLYGIAVETGLSYGAFEDVAEFGIILSANAVILGVFCGSRTVSRIRMSGKNGVSELYRTLPVSWGERLFTAIIVEVLRYAVCTVGILTLFLGLEVARGIDITEMWVGVPAVSGMLIGYFILYYSVAFLAAVLSDSTVFQLCFCATFWLGCGVYLNYAVVLAPALNRVATGGYSYDVTCRIASGCAPLNMFILTGIDEIPTELTEYAVNLRYSLIIAAVLLVLGFALVTLRRRFDGFEAREVAGARDGLVCVTSAVLFFMGTFRMICRKTFISEIADEYKYVTIGMLAPKTYMLLALIFLGTSFLIKGMKKTTVSLTLLPPYMLFMILLLNGIYSH